MVSTTEGMTLIFQILTRYVSTVTADVNARKVVVKGKRGAVSKDFSHVACELKKMKQDTPKRKGLYIRIRIWFGGYKQACAVNTLKSLIGNMIIGVTEVSWFPSTQAETAHRREFIFFRWLSCA